MNNQYSAGPSKNPLLTDAHWHMLTVESGIAPEVIAERGYRTCTGHSELKSLGITISKKWYGSGGLLIPLHLPDGTHAGHWLPHEQRMAPLTVYRPDTPLIGPHGRERKYLYPTGGQIHLDAHPRCQSAMRDTTQFLWVTEGIKKGDALVTQGACVVALNGVDCWKTLDWRDVDVQARPVGIVYDSDVMQKAEVRRALDSLTSYLTGKGAQVQHVYLPSQGPVKVGVDDYLLTHTLADLAGLLVAPQRPHQAAGFPPGDWRTALLVSSQGRPLETFGNLRLCAAEAAKGSTNLWYDAVADRAMSGDDPLTDALVERAALEIERFVRIPIRNLTLVRTAIVAQCRETTRDPIRTWLESLPPWDQTPRLTTWLAHHAHAANTAYVQATSRLWLVSMVARALQPGCQCRSVLVLIGDEDIGKSKLVKLLASERWYRDVSGSLEGKEAHMLLKGTWVVELGELATMGKTEENRLKSFITMTNDEFIPKYANDPVKLARRTILVGTMNPDGDQTFLRAQSGNTRYYPVPVGLVDLEKIAALREQLFAEALDYYHGHADSWWQLSTPEEQEAKAIREDYRIKSAYEEALSVWLTGKTITCWQEICEGFLLLEAKEKWRDTRLQREIAVGMRANDWRQDKQQRLMGYGQVRPWKAP